MPEPDRPDRYPRTVAEIIDDNMRFRRATVQAVLRFKRSRPWRGTPRERKRKFRLLHGELCRIYGKSTRLFFVSLDVRCSGLSSYDGLSDLIVLRGRLSVTTYLHEFAHALGKGERDACRWSVNLFKRCFPDQFARCRSEGHMLRGPRRHRHRQS